MAAYRRVYDMTHVTCRLTAKNRDQLRNPSLGNRVWATFLVEFNSFTYLNCRACFQSLHARCSLLPPSRMFQSCVFVVAECRSAQHVTASSVARRRCRYPVIRVRRACGIAAVLCRFTANAFVSETLARARYVESIPGFQQPTPTKQLPSTRFAINEPAQLVWLRDAESSIVPICPCILLSVFHCFMQMLINYCHIYMD